MSQNEENNPSKKIIEGNDDTIKNDSEISNEGERSFSNDSSREGETSFSYPLKKALDEVLPCTLSF